MEIGQLRFLVIWWCSTVQGGSVFVGRCYKGPNGLLGWIEWRSWWLGHLQGVFVPYLGFGLRWFCTDSIPWDSSPWISTHQFGRKIYSANLKLRIWWVVFLTAPPAARKDNYFSTDWVCVVYRYAPPTDVFVAAMKVCFGIPGHLKM